MVFGKGWGPFRVAHSLPRALRFPRPGGGAKIFKDVATQTYLHMSPDDDVSYSDDEAR